MLYPAPMGRLIHELAKLPGVGPKTAQRLAFHILELNETEVKRLVEAMVDAKQKMGFCSVCGQLAEKSPCTICDDRLRNQKLLCVVEEPKDVIAMEKTRVFKGLYHVLGGAISPLEGIGPDDLKIKELLHRIEEGQFDEVIIATDPNVEGEATALYLAKLLKPFGLKVTRLARGLPVGGDLEYADEITLSKALEGRVEF
ncbi:MAG TPA: recombination mediator RecR [Bacillota bacterium]|jgi:recombination protein RecR|nr:recombination mediator RecR [Bacillota bacterium]HOL08609.1 recombination mediator RecR [Bacillota bacterium]HPO98408.1 recombination mediator RecR [Bacillota bacterium]